MACYVIVLNYKGWKDTIECLDSIFQSKDADYKVIVCDNGSDNDSLYYIENWAKGKLSVQDINKNTLLKNHLPSRPEYLLWNQPKYESYDAPLLLVDNKKNKGFAAGNNVGIKIAMTQEDCESLFILNNDTIILADTIKNGVDQLKKYSNTGVCSTNVKYYNEPSKSAWMPSFYLPIIGTEVGHKPRFIKNFLPKYTGMSFFVTHEFIQNVGLMEERYFLYYEEFDWSYKMKDKFSMTIAKDSIVYHKEGQSSSYCSPLSLFCMIRSNILFSRWYYPQFFLIVYCIWWMRFLKRVVTGKWDEGKIILKFLIFFLIQGEDYHGGFF